MTPQDLGRRRLLLERLGELARPVLDLLLEGGVRLVELGRHAVELVGEPLELVARLHVDPLVERARPDPLRARLERPDRGRHAPGQEEARQHRERHAGDEEGDGAVRRGIEGREGLAEGLLHEDPPAERRDRRRCRQDLAPAGVLGHGHLPVRRARRRRAGQRRPDLLEPREVGLLEDEADVRVGDELPPAVHDVGAPRRPDPDLGDDVPDELQVDLGDGHARVAAAGHREREVGLGLLPEVDGPEVGPARPRLLEARIGGEVGLAPHHVHGETRDLELLPARGVELAHLGDRGRLALEADELEAPLLDRLPGADLALARPPHLALDVADEGVDARGGPGRLLPLERHHGRQVLAIGEVELDEAAREQGAAHQDREEHDVLPEQPASRPDCYAHSTSR